MEFSINDKIEIGVWLDTLRSGKYAQTDGCLQDNRGYCCLGVACDLFIAKEDRKTYGCNGYLMGALPEDQEHAPDWLKYLGNKSIGVSLNPTTIAVFNDSGKSFEEMAGIIENEFLK